MPVYDFATKPIYFKPLSKGKVSFSNKVLFKTRQLFKQFEQFYLFKHVKNSEHCTGIAEAMGSNPQEIS